MSRAAIAALMLAPGLSWGAPTTQPARAKVTTVVVAPLSNSTPNKDYDAVAAGMSDMLAVSLADSADVRVVEREKLNKVLAEQRLTLKGLTDAKTAARVGKLLKADQVITGGIQPAEKGKLLLVAYSIDVSSARVVAADRVTGNPEELLKMAVDLSHKIHDRLHIRFKPVDPKDIDKNPQASLHFMKGLGFYYGGNYDRAIVEFMKTRDLEPNHPLCNFWAGKAYFEMKEYIHARIELNEFLDQFPKTPESKEARRMIKICKESVPLSPIPRLVPESRPATKPGKS